MSAGHPQAGFTLLEMLLAVTILAVLLATVYGALSRTASSKEIAEERAQVVASGRQAVLRMAGDIEGSLPPTAGDRLYFRGTGGGLGGAPSLEFITTNRGGYGLNRVRPGRVLIAYSLDPLPGQAAGSALRREEYLYSAMLAEADGVQLPQPEEGEEAAPTAQATYLIDCPSIPDEFHLPGSCMRVTGLRYRYYDEVVRDWRDEWDSTQEATLSRLPAAVEIALVVADRDGVEHDFGTIVDLPLARGQPTAVPGRAQVAGEESGEPETTQGSTGARGSTSPQGSTGGRGSTGARGFRP